MAEKTTSRAEKMTSRLPATAGAGRVVGDRYSLGAVIGQGGMARVHRGYDLRLERAVAVKILSSSPVADRERFAAEVRILARLDHPNLVRVLDAGVDCDEDFLVMELVEGTNLARAIEERLLADDELAAVGTAVASALAYVHGQGIVHRDIKPANVLLGSDGRARLADFGIARAADSAGFTVTGAVIGTPAYLAPEQLGHAEVGPPSDIYSLGLVLAECLTGRRIFQGDAREVAAARLATDPELPPEISADWRVLLRSMTARHPASRPTAGEVCAYLDTVARAGRARSGSLSPEPPALRTMILEDTAGPSTAPAVSSIGPGPGERVAARRNKRWLPVLALAVAVLLGLILGRELLAPSPATGQGTHASTTTTLKVTSTTSAPTTTRPASTTTTTVVRPASPTISSETGALIGALSGGQRDGTVTPQAAQDIYNHLGQLLFISAPNPPNSGNPGSGPPDPKGQNVAQQYQQLLHAYYQDASNGGISGQAAAEVLSAVETIGRLLGV